MPRPRALIADAEVAVRAVEPTLLEGGKHAEIVVGWQPVEAEEGTLRNGKVEEHQRR